MPATTSKSSQPLSPAASMRLTVKSAYTLSRRLAFFSFVIALAALLSYPLGIAESFAATQGPAIHPVTALCAFMLAMCIAINGTHARLASQTINSLTVFVITVATLQLLFPLLVARFVDPLFTFAGSIVFGQLPIASGLATACLLLLALSIRLRARNAYLPQILAVLAYCLPALLLVKYVLDLKHPYGRVLLVSALMLIPLCAAVTLSTVHQGFLRMLLGPTRISALTRRYLLLTMLVPYLLGVIIARMTPVAANIWFLLLFVATSQLVGLCVCFLSLSFYKLERQESDALNPLRSAMN
jgi:hypothetical protein